MIEYTNQPTQAFIDFLTQQINQETLDYGQATPFAFSIKDETSQRLIAGTNGFLMFGAVYIDQLWVCPSQRRKGLATKLIEQVHEYGRGQGCQFVTIDTMDFQKAMPFYQSLGYTIDFEKSGYHNGGKCLFISKDLRP